MNKNSKFKVFVSFMMFFCFIFIAVTGIVLYITPPGGTAYWLKWKFIGLSKSRWERLHTVFTFLFIFFATFHIIYNWKLIVNYLKKKTKNGLKYRNEIIISILVVILTAAGTITVIPPFSSVYNIGEKIRASWSENKKSPPVSHAERLSILELSKYLNIKPEKILNILLKNKIKIKNSKQTLEEIAENNKTAPYKIYFIIKKNL